MFSTYWDMYVHLLIGILRDISCFYDSQCGLIKYYQFHLFGSMDRWRVKIFLLRITKDFILMVRKTLIFLCLELLTASVLGPECLHPFWNLKNMKYIQPFSCQSMLHILVQDSGPCRAEMAFLLGLRYEFWLLLQALKLQCIVFVRCSAPDSVLITDMHLNSNTTDHCDRI